MARSQHARELWSIVYPNRMPLPGQKHMTITTLPKIVVLIGPTAVGKTRLSLELAQEFDAEIVNADSRLFYRGMDIGTAKPSRAELSAVPHHLVDFLEPNDPISLATVQDLAFAAIDDILQRKKLPLLVGGTPQYVNAIVENWRIPRVEPNPELRDQLEQEEAAHPGVLLERLRAVDPLGAEKHAGNTRRIIRALEVHEATGQPITELQSKDQPRYHALEIGLWRPREELHERIRHRQRQQVEGGLPDEVRALLAAGADPSSGSFSSIGYRQMLPYLAGDATLEETIERIQLDCNRLVRHQETWLRKNPRLVRIDMSQPGAETEIRDRIRIFLDE